MAIIVERLGLPGLLAIEPGRYADSRGLFAETYNVRDFAAAGIDAAFVQDNHSLSVKAGTVRGLHFQNPPDAQAKLVRVIRGSILDVTVDLRIGSPTYGQHATVLLSAGNWKQLFVPVGLAHGFCTLEADTEVIYKATVFYAPKSDAGLLWNDSALKISWPDIAGSEISDKDLRLPPLREIQSQFRFDQNSS